MSWTQKLASVGELKERKGEVLGMVDGNELDDGVAILISLLAERFLHRPLLKEIFSVDIPLI